MRPLPVFAVSFALLGSAAFAQTPVYTTWGTKAKDNHGWSIAAVGDVNGDGHADYAVGAPGDVVATATVPGTVEVRSGKNGNLLHKLTGVKNGDRFGYAVAPIGDHDQDGSADFAVGAPAFSPAGLSAAGAVYLYSGQTGQVFYALHGESNGEQFGAAIAMIGDIDGDLVSELLIGAPKTTTTSAATGEVRWFDGATGTLIQKIPGTIANSGLGTSVCGPGDLNGDGFADIVFGAPAEQLGPWPTGAVYAYTHKGLLLGTAIGDNLDDRLGHSVAPAGDYGADGVLDLLIGVPKRDVMGFDSGTVRIVVGKSGALLKEVHGESAGNQFGTAVAGTGDLDQDGTPDFIAGAAPASYAKLVSGGNGTDLLKYLGTGGSYGTAVAFLGDLDQDGGQNVAIGGPGLQNPSNVAAGVAFVLPTEPAKSVLTLDSTAQIAGTFNPNGPLPDPVKRLVGNSGSDPLNWSVTIDGAPGWVAATPASGMVAPGAPPTEVTFTLDPTGLPQATHTTTVRFQNDDNLVNKIATQAKLTVGPPVNDPALCVLGPTSVNVTHLVGDPNPAPIEFIVKNCGDLKDTLTWHSTLFGAAANFVTIDPPNGVIPPGGAPVTVQVHLDPAGLAPGAYSGAFRLINSNKASNNFAAPVNFTVELATFTVGDLLLGGIDTPTDADLAVFFGLEGSTLKIKSVPQPGGLRPLLMLMDGEGVLLETWKMKKGKTTKKKFKVPASGTYQLRIEGAGGTTGDYKILSDRKLPQISKQRVVKGVTPAEGSTSAEVEIGLMPEAVLSANVEVKGSMTVEQLTVQFVTPAGQVFDTTAFSTTSLYGFHLVNVPLVEGGVYKLVIGGFALPSDKVKVPVMPLQPPKGKDAVHLN